VRTLFVVIALTAACATPKDAFVCTDSSQCKDGTGTCESNGFCSFADSTCPSGKRYGDLAGGGLSDQCWENPNGTFDVAMAVSTSHTSVAVTFSNPPDPVAAIQLSNYAINGLVISGTPVLSGSTVTFTTDVQTAMMYTLTASNITRASDSAPLYMTTATFIGRAPFNVASAAATTHSTMTVTFDAAPNATEATNLGNYSVAGGLTLTGTPTVSGNTVSFTTSPQSMIDYTVTVANVHRAADGEPLTTAMATFVGRTDFNVASATSLNSAAVSVTFDAPPNTAQATTLASYSIPGLTLSGAPVLSGNTVTLTTSAQGAQTYTVTVTGVTRASDAEPLLVASANFSGINTFNVASAAAVTTHAVTVTFDAPPNPTQATTPANYNIPGISVTGVQAISGNTVTLTTSTQSATTYTAMVANVTRASDGEPLAVTSAMFSGRPPFDVASAASVTSHSISVTFDSVPNAAQATTLTNYSVTGLTLSGTPTLSGSTVTITTSPQSATTYTVNVVNVTRNSDGEALTSSSATFTGRTQFDVVSAISTKTTQIQVVFDAAPNAAQATTLTHYNVSGLTLSGTPTLSGNTVTLTTSQQSATTYAVTVSGVTRSSDAEPLTVNNASFTGRPPFDVSSAASTSNVAMTVTFDAAPDPTQATNISNYSVSGLALSGTPTLSGNTVTITTASQTVTTYTVNVSGVTRASDGEALTTSSAMFTGKTGFNVASASSVDTFTMSVTFDAAPTPAQATNISNYNVPGLTLTGTPTLAGNTVTITTSAQAGMTYTVTVTGVTRASDSSPLQVFTASFTHVTFNVSSAASITSHQISVTFDAAPNAGQATALGNYSVSGLTLSGTPVLSGNTVTITTSAQAAMTYTVMVTNVTRNSDGSILSTSMASFTGRPPFDVQSAAATTSGTMTVTFDAAPNAAQATTLTNYTVPGLTLSGPVTLSGNMVSMNTTAQSGITYTVNASNVTRASDGEAMTTNNASFSGMALATPVVTTVVVQSTTPNNGTTFYNTGTATVLITGSEFTGVTCLTGVALDDTDGNGTLVGTHPTSCNVAPGGQQITATFPAGISTNGATGWNVKVTNAVGTNATSSQKLMIKAGLVVSEVFTGVSAGNGNQHEFIELYNPTANPISVTGIGLRFHIRTAAAGDTALTVTYTNSTLISHGHLLLISTATKTTEAWYSHRDATYDASITELADNGGVYLSLSATAQSKVLDKMGYGTQPVHGYEGTAMANIPLDSSGQRKPAGTMGAGTDTDVNSADFNAPSTSITPLGTNDPAQP
jgi:hypothetical protein